MDQVKQLSGLINTLFTSIESQIPAVEQEALMLIKNKCTDIKEIEYCLDTLYSLHISGFKVTAYEQLINWLRQLNPTIAAWHQKEFQRNHD
jgi:hypothetical protein